MPTCDILLAAYNGTRYGPALLDSLLAQTCQDYRLLVRDDGSTDTTLEMLNDYAPKFGGRMQFVSRGAPTGSAMGNFSILMEASDADYSLWADIDDVWLPHKVEKTLALLAVTESRAPAGAPVYVFTDVQPVDGNLKPLAHSYWQFKKIDPEVGRRLNQSLVCTVTLGCASGMNRSLRRMATPVPPTVTGHDWWAQLVAAAFGDVGYSSDITMLYRLHGANASSPKRVGYIDYLFGNNKIAAVRRGMWRRRDQAQALLDRFGDQLNPESRNLIQNFVRTGSEGFLRRRLSILRGGFLYADAPRNLAMLLGM